MGRDPCAGSVPRDRLVQVQERRGPPRSRPPARPGRRPAGAGVSPTAEQLRGRGGVGAILPLVLRQERAAGPRPRRAAAVGPGPVGRRGRAGPTGRARPRGSAARPGPGPPRRRSGRSAAPAPAAACSTAAARPCIPRASRRRRPAGSGAGTSAASRCRARGDTGSRPWSASYSRLREVEEDPVARRLVRLDARPADLGREQAADRQGVVADELGVEPEARSAGRASGWTGRAAGRLGRGRDDWR